MNSIKKDQADNASSAKPIIGYTSGVFDMFHAGHLHLLNEAKTLCDILIVGVTTDELVAYKSTEVVIPFEERIEIIRNIKCVDQAIAQDDLDKYAMWEKHSFDVMFIGDDWHNTRRFKEFEKKLSGVGVQIKYLPYTKGVSTSKRKEKIKSNSTSKPSEIEMPKGIETLWQKLIRGKRWATDAVFGRSVMRRMKALRTEDYSKVYAETNRNHKSLVLGVQAGRGGMKWVCEIFSAHQNAKGGGERNRLAESFYRYVKWNQLPIDVEGVIEVTKKEILDDWKTVPISLLSTPYFATDFYSVYDALKANFVIWALNDPLFTVTSFYNKGWYLHEPIRKDISKACGMQPALENEWSHFLGRPIPSGGFYEEWAGLTRVGKIAWFLNEVNKSIYESIQQIPHAQLWVFRLKEANQNYEYYLRMAESFKLAPLLKKEQFLSLRKRVSSENENVPFQWSKREKAELEQYAADYIRFYETVKGIESTS